MLVALITDRVSLDRIATRLKRTKRAVATRIVRLRKQSSTPAHEAAASSAGTLGRFANNAPIDKDVD